MCSWCSPPPPQITIVQPWDRVLVPLQGIHITVPLSFSAELKPPTDRLPGGWRQDPPKPRNPKCGCSPWRPAVDTLSRNVDAQAGQQEIMVCEKQLPAYINHLQALTAHCQGTQPPTPPLTFPFSFFIVSATSSHLELQPQIPATDPL